MKTNLHGLKAYGLSLALLFSLVAAGCGIGTPRDDENKAQQVKDNADIQSRYQIIVGTYRGVLDLDNNPNKLPAQPGELRLYVKIVASGTYSDGSIKTVPELHGRFRLDNIPAASDNTDMKGDYSTSGDLEIAQDTSVPGSDSTKYIAVSGTVLGVNMSRIKIMHYGGTWGYFTATRTNTDASAPAEGDQELDRERLRRIYGQIEGVYTAKITSPSGIGFAAQISVIEDIVADPAGNLNPSLRALFQDLSVDPGYGIGTYQMRVDYDPLTGHISMLSITPDRQPASSQLSVIGSLINKRLLAEVRQRGELVGTIDTIGK